MAPAVSVMSSSGRMPSRTIHRASSNRAIITAIDTNSSTWVSEARVLSVGSSEMAVTSGAAGHRHRLHPVRATPLDPTAGTSIDRLSGE